MPPINESVMIAAARLIALVALVSAALTSATAQDRPRVIVTADGEVDDRCSMTRFLLYTNEWDVRGLIHSGSKHHWKGDADHAEKNWEPVEWLDERIDAYAEVYANLRLHDPAYPHPGDLRESVRVGNIAFEGDMKDPTPGSDRIVEILLSPEESPVWLQAWGGPNTIARALKTIKDDYPDHITEVTRKARLYLISRQDATYKNYIEPEWPGIHVLQSNNASYGALAYRWTQVMPAETQTWFDAAWMAENILDDHGPLCAMYETNKDGSFRSEGDSPAFLHLIPTGLQNERNPGYGGWGGRFTRTEKYRWKSADIAGIRPHSIARWATEFQNDWAARADWCVRPVAEANHAPQVALNHANTINVTPGERVPLDARPSTDPDNDDLTFRWWHHREAGTYTGTLQPQSETSPATTIHIPADAKPGDTIHLICSVTDLGTPPLTRYARVVLTIGDSSLVP